MIDPEVKRAQIQKAVKWGVIALACAVSYPIAILAVQGMLAWAVAAGIALVVSNFAPVIGTWMANKRVQALIAIIEANPIETMQNLYAEKSEELNTAEHSITDFEVSLGNFGDQVAAVRKEYPEEAQTYIDIEKKMKECLTSMREEHTFATKELASFKAKIKKATVLFQMAKAANTMLEKSQSAQAEVFAQIKEQVSFDKVRTDLNRAFANMNTAIERRKNSAVFRPVKELESLNENQPTPSYGKIPQKTIGG